MSNKVVEHLMMQVEAIQTDMVWIKKAIWTLAGAGLTFNITLAAGIILYLLRKS